MDRPGHHHLTSSIRTAADPVIGWRYWHLEFDPVRLGSVTQRGYSWKPGRPIHARCASSGHPAPAPGCACGVYAGVDLAALCEHGLCLPAGGLVVGEVATWGLVLTEEDGYRGEYGYPHRLSVVEETVAAGALPNALAALATAYGVPVDTVARAEAVGEVSSAIAAFLDMSGR